MAPSRAVSRSKVSSQGNVVQDLWRSYLDDTPARLQLCDAFLVFHMLCGVLLFVYVFLVAYPFNAFLAAFASNVGQFVLIASLRMQVNAANKAEFGGTSPERAFAEFCFASIVLHAFVVHYLG